MSRSKTPQCSFCQKKQDKVAKLISSPSATDEAYICDECVAVCNSILEDSGMAPLPIPERPSHCLMCHPMAPALLLRVERWAREEVGGRDADPLLEQVRRMARAMMGLDAA